MKMVLGGMEAKGGSVLENTVKFYFFLNFPSQVCRISEKKLGGSFSAEGLLLLTYKD